MRGPALNVWALACPPAGAQAPPPGTPRPPRKHNNPEP
jgi:hypothetical protein